MLIMSHVTKKYGQVVALRDITLHIRKGEFAFLVGSSGAGKSTLMRLFFRQEEPSEGTIMVDGVNIARMPRKKIPRVRRKIGVVFQDFKLLNDKSVYNNIRFVLEVTGAPNSYIKRRVPQVLDMVGLGERADEMPAKLSGGEQQRVSLARAIANSPPVILADEPTGNLDRENAWHIMKILEGLNKRGVTVLVATHDWPIVDAMKKRVIEIEDGRLVRDDQEGGYAPDVPSSKAVSR